MDRVMDNPLVAANLLIAQELYASATALGWDEEDKETQDWYLSRADQVTDYIAKTASIKDQEYQEKIREIFKDIEKFADNMLMAFDHLQSYKNIKAKYLGKEEA